MEGGAVRIDLDKLPIKRLDAIDEFGNEQFPPELGHEEKRLSMIRRIDFSFVVEKDVKQAKSSKETVAQQPAWPWQGLVENLQLAHQELSVILDLINRVEANDAVAVAGMQRPKPLGNEVLSDLAVSAATKLQRLRQLGRYFKQSSKAMDQQVSRDARFYGSLIRLQQNWKVKRHRMAATGPGSEGFTFDLLDNSVSDFTALSSPSSVSTVRVDHHCSGILSIQKPQKSCYSLSLRFIGVDPSCKQKSSRKIYSLAEHPRVAKKEALSAEDVNECIKDTHSILREIHQSIFEEQVFDMVNHETYNPLSGISVTGMREDFLQLAIGQETSVRLCLVPSGKEEASHMIDSTGDGQNGESGLLNSDSMELAIIRDEKHDFLKTNISETPNPVSLEIYLLFIFHENVLARAKERRSCATRSQVPGQPPCVSYGVLGHFCMTVAHRIFSNKVLSELECLVNGVPYLQLLSHTTWHCRTSSWSLSLKVPHSVLHAGRQSKISDNHCVKHETRSQFHTKVVVKDDQINVSGEGAPNIIGSFRGSSDVCSMNCYGCDLEDLPMILLQQVASQVIRWLHEEALVVGMRATSDFLCLYFDLDHGDTLGLVAHVDPDDINGCISWWVVMDDGSMEDGGKILTDFGESGSRRFLGYLSLEALYSTVMDLASLCSIGGIHWHV